MESNTTCVDKQLTNCSGSYNHSNMKKENKFKNRRGEALEAV